MNNWNPDTITDRKMLRPAPSVKEMGEHFEKLAAKYPDQVTVRKLGRSVGGLPLWHLKLTERQTPGEDKQRILFCGAEHGSERSATTTLLQLIDWLLGKAGRTILRQQEVHLFPCVNPDGYDHLAFGNRNGVNLFADYFLDGRKPTQPEAAALGGLLDELQPDAFCNIHGLYQITDLTAVMENTGIVQSNQYERCHQPDVIARLNRVAEAAGFPQDRGEDDAERILPRLPGFHNHSFNTYEMLGSSGLHAYNNYHTLVVIFETMCEESGLVRCQELLRIGNERWPYNADRGYPNLVMSTFAHLFVVAPGRTAAVRRANRVKIWRYNENILLLQNCVTPGANLHFAAVATAKKDYETWAVPREGATMKDFINLMELDEKRKTALRAFCAPLLDSWYNFGKNTRDAVPDWTQAADGFPVGIRQRFPKNITIRHVMVNGVKLARKQCRIWTDARYQYLQLEQPSQDRFLCVAVTYS